ncbi:hypothetical protein B1748_33155 [Paenibacillus sp. MY03]|nr:hypothetical protein B1748_33155 [Paenibacillus sp. MY03]
MTQPTGPASARKVEPAVMPPPPATTAPPPSHANAAFVAAAPLNAEMAVPVEAVPKVMATAIAAVGPNAATPAPAATPAAPKPVDVFAVLSNSALIWKIAFSNFLNSILIFSIFTIISSGLFFMLFK